MLRLRTITIICSLLCATVAHAAGYESRLDSLQRRFTISHSGMLGSDPRSRREMECLALNVYFEARGTITKQQEGVAWVAKNRAASDRFNGPDLCDVIFQPGQFAWTRGPSRAAFESDAWAEAQDIAYGVYHGSIADPTHGSLYFHEVNLAPRYRKYAHNGLRIGSHVFYNMAAK